jgi:hypothetical protein
MSKSAWVVAIWLLTVPLNSHAAEKPKPECTEKTRGKIWPEKTSRGADVPIEICAPKRFHYEWQQLTIDVSQLKSTPKKNEQAPVRE